MASRNRGAKKPKLRDLSQHPLSDEEATALFEAIQPAAPPIVTAITGAVFVEHELESCLRYRLPRKDDESWFELLDERGPLDTFSRKIIMGYALRLYDDAFRKNLDIVRIVRNAFAHSKRLIDFEHPLVAKEINRIAIPISGRKSFSQLKTQQFQQNQIYPALCLTLGIQLMKIRIRSNKAKLYRSNKKLLISPLGRALGSQFSPAAYEMFLQANPGLNLPTSQPGQISELTGEAPRGLLDGLLPYLAAKRDKTDKT